MAVVLLPGTSTCRLKSSIPCHDLSYSRWLGCLLRSLFILGLRVCRSFHENEHHAILGFQIRQLRRLTIPYDIHVLWHVYGAWTAIGTLLGSH